MQLYRSSKEWLITGPQELFDYATGSGTRFGSTPKSFLIAAGIFKIEDSVLVAKLWGERKNRPMMNYDKLSRSIRQYYKHGIIKKPSNKSRRLVFQFCPQYI
jgi:hypothetical protein